MSKKEKKVLYEWKIHPASKKPVQALFVYLFLIITSLLIFFTFRDLFFAGLGFIILNLSLTNYFLPTIYKIYEDEIVALYPFSKRKENLSKFRAVIKDRNGFLLSTIRNPSLVHEIRGFFLIVPNEFKDKVYKILEGIIENSSKE